MRNFEGIEIGDRRLVSRVITEQDVETFAGITGDCSPLHLDEEFAKKTVFKGRIAHGMLIAGLISAALGKFPGVVVYLWQNLSFLKPVRAGDRIEASAEVLEKVSERSELRLKTTCRNQRGEMVVDGEAKVKIMELESSGEGKTAGL